MEDRELDNRRLRNCRWLATAVALLRSGRDLAPLLTDLFVVGKDHDLAQPVLECLATAWSPAADFGSLVQLDERYEREGCGSVGEFLGQLVG